MAEKVYRSGGLTDSEQELAKIADKTFLNLWSYSNLYYKFGSDVSEFCDLFVVCGDFALIFSDKMIEFQKDAPLQIAWNRWYSRAIEKSKTQVVKAIKRLKINPDKIYLDKDCTIPFPLQIPKNIKIHGIVVARGSAEACKTFYGGGSGSLRFSSSCNGTEPFCVGDINPQAEFIHVLDDFTLGVALKELDTITDFVEYLEKKQEAIRKMAFFHASGEEDIISYYLAHTNEYEEHDIVHPEGGAWDQNSALFIEDEIYFEMIENPIYIGKKEENKISYLWDEFINQFTNHLLDGTCLVPEGEEFILSEREIAVRYMALERRTSRRVYGKAIFDVLKNKSYLPSFFRAMLPHPSSKEETGFFFLTVAYREGKFKDYNQYRNVRSNMLYNYGVSILNKNRNLKRVVGIATEPIQNNESAKKERSEDIVFIEYNEWTPEDEEEAQLISHMTGIFQEQTLKVYHIHEDEYPS